MLTQRSKGKVLLRDPGYTPRATPMDSTLGFFNRIAAFYAWLCQMLSVLFMTLNMVLFGRAPLITHQLNMFSHKIVVLGDDFAFGVGDKTSLGVSSGLPYHLRTHLKGDRRLKHQWRIYNRGVMGSTTSEWLPSEGGKGGKSLMDWALSKTQDAEIFIVLLGFNDVRAEALGKAAISPEDTVNNIERICNYLRGLGKEVWLCPFSTWGDKSVLPEDLVDANAQRNKLLLEFMETKKEYVNKGPNIDGKSFEFHLKAFYSSDGIHFSRKGYVKLSKDFYDLISTQLIKIEFQVIKRQLGL
ncbi:hypothetical protein HDU67_004041 [Dinochytrium kinnereticum]|nr:hypothetical protein HDU67_004041 [Dinochytrium kinnereticum]